MRVSLILVTINITWKNGDKRTIQFVTTPNVIGAGFNHTFTGNAAVAAATGWNKGLSGGLEDALFGAIGAGFASEASQRRYAHAQQNTYDPRADFRDYAVQLSNDKSQTDCLKLALLVYKAGQVWGGDATVGLLGGLTEFSAILPGTLPPSDPNYRVGVYVKDTYYASSFEGSGFLPQFIKPDEPHSNRIRHFVAYLAAGQAAPDALARRALHNSEGTRDPRNPDVALGEAAIQMGSHMKNFDYRQLAQDVWHNICGQTSNLNLP
jgi:hypothetical protein